MGQSELHQKSTCQIAPSSFPVIDLHCDLLYYLGLQPGRSPQDPISKCSFPQLKKGGVSVQLLPLSADICSSLEMGLKQLSAFISLLTSEEDHPTLLLAVENLSALCLEEEPLRNVLERLQTKFLPHKPVYASLTWNGENRFGGGILNGKGLKEEGKILLDFLAPYPIAIDLSHASDLLAFDILNYLDQKNLPLAVMASHSNARKIKSVPRNLPDEIAKEIIRRKGLIGLVLYPKFLTDIEELPSHITHFLELGGKECLAFGADFFCWNDFANLTSASHPIKGLENASCYPYVLSFLQRVFPSSLCEQISFTNAALFLERLQGIKVTRKSDQKSVYCEQ